MMQEIFAEYKRKVLFSLPAKVFRVLRLDAERSDLFKHASGMAYVTLFSLVPSLAAVFALISLFKPVFGPGSQIFDLVQSFILTNLATGTGQMVTSHIRGFLANLNMTKIGLTGFLGLIFSLVLILRQIELAFNTIWQVSKPRHVIMRFIYFWTF